MPSRDREFRASTATGDIVGWLRQSAGSNPKALLLHGGPGLSEYMAPASTEIGDLVTSARYQQRGLAPSPKSGDVSLEGHVADAVAVMDELGWQRPVVIGHSWGGHLAMHLATTHPDRVSALVIIDALGATDRGGQREFGPNLRRGLTVSQLERLHVLEEIDSPSPDEIREHLGILWPNYFADPSHPAPMPATEFASNADQTWVSIQAHFRRGTLARRLPGLDIPTLVLHGEKSPIPIIQGQRIAQLIPGGRLEIMPAVGHWPWLERPGYLHEALEPFLASL